MDVASSCFDSLVRCSALELCVFPPMYCAVRGMTSWLPMDELLRSGDMATDQSHSTGSQMNPQRLRRPLRKRAKIGTTIGMPIGPSTPRVALRFLEEVCAHWWRLTDRRR